MSNSNFYMMLDKFFNLYLPYQRNCSYNTIRSYKTAIRSCIEYISEENRIPKTSINYELFTKENIGGFLDHLEKTGSSVRTRNQRLASLQSFFRYVSDQDFTLTRYREELRKVPIKKTGFLEDEHILTKDEVRHIISMTNAFPDIELRNRTIIAFMYDTAARVDEVTRVKIRDLQLYRGGGKVILHGKGNKTRSVPLSDSTASLIKQWMECRHGSCGENRYLFGTKHHQVYNRMSTDNIRKIVRFYASKARITMPSIPVRVHPHQFRHARATHLLEDGVDLYTISQLLGHAKVETTQKYAYLSVEMERSAIFAANARPDNPLADLMNTEKFILSDKQIEDIFSSRRIPCYRDSQ